ncbi:DUF4376 domain-containing protein [Pseudomonas tohonis]|nr:DUF4376 domain-containing protein [Pseudomonas tohonis]
MKYFRHIKNGAVFAYEQDGSQDQLIAQELVPMSAGEVEAHLNPTRRPRPVDVDVERDRRIKDGIQFEGYLFQSRSADHSNIIEAAQLAFMAMANGISPGNLRWFDPERDFVWIAVDNSRVPMDAPTVVALAKAVAERKQSLIYAGRRLKDMEIIPSDYTDDKWWG